MYHGKLIVRFEGTNPSKEKLEFEDSNVEALAALGIHEDPVTHTSDHFDKLYERQREQMQKERMDGIPSTRRDATISENLANFALMTKGTPEVLEFRLRAKLSVVDPNKVMGDPVIYRCNVGSRIIRLGICGKYTRRVTLLVQSSALSKALPMRSGRMYRDRNPQYHWMLDALGLRKVNIWDFSRLGFVYTFLSKRKLRIRRRGMTLAALRQYMLDQGPSQNQILLEWDSICLMNKKIIDPVAPRFCALAKEGIVKVHITGAPKTPEVVSVPKHKKHPDVGTKSTVLPNTIYIEQVDALTETPLYGRSRATRKAVSSLDMKLHLSGDVKTTDKKIAWLSVPSTPHTLPSVTLLDYDFLTKGLEKDDSVESCANKETEFRVDTFADGTAAGLALKTVVPDAAQKEEPAVTTKMVPSLYNVKIVPPDVMYKIPDRDEDQWRLDLKFAHLLSMHSPVFADMFSMPQPDTDSMENGFDGLPVVEISDNDTDFMHLLCFVYDHRYYQGGMETTFEKISGLLRMSTKYQMDDLRNEILSHLALAYPSTYKKYTDAVDTTIQAPLFPPFRGQHFAVVALGRETDSSILLPAAMWRSTSPRTPPERNISYLLPDAKLCILKKSIHYKKLVQVETTLATAVLNESNCVRRNEQRKLTWAGTQQEEKASRHAWK
ncbi:Nucleotidylyl transferase [Rickenella mellea]|uniref:Nucleotidylyl transferase n=1 Tax=Rickenella mellea TaxID=50990 RepID=A0A4Y7PQ94_9AGAM|nr:Nucleotidylyl transferase [Rickenella mellea]